MYFTTWPLSYAPSHFLVRSLPNTKVASHQLVSSSFILNIIWSTPYIARSSQLAGSYVRSLPHGSYNYVSKQKRVSSRSLQGLCHGPYKPISYCTRQWHQNAIISRAKQNVKARGKKYQYIITTQHASQKRKRWIQFICAAYCRNQLRG